MGKVRGHCVGIRGCHRANVSPTVPHEQIPWLALCPQVDGGVPWICRSSCLVPPPCPHSLKFCVVVTTISDNLVGSKPIQHANSPVDINCTYFSNLEKDTKSFHWPFYPYTERVLPSYPFNVGELNKPTTMTHSSLSADCNDYLTRAYNLEV